MNKRQLKKLSKIAMQAVIQSCDWLDESHFDEEYVCHESDGFGEHFEAAAFGMLSMQYRNKLCEEEVKLQFNNTENGVFIIHYPNIKHLSFANTIHFMANYLKAASNG